MPRHVVHQRSKQLVAGRVGSWHRLIRDVLLDVRVQRRGAALRDMGQWVLHLRNDTLEAKALLHRSRGGGS